MKEFSQGDGRNDKDFPTLHGGKVVSVLGDDTVKEGCPASEITDEEKGTINFLFQVSPVKEIIQKESEPSPNENKGKKDTTQTISRKRLGPGFFAEKSRKRSVKKSR